MTERSAADVPRDGEGRPFITLAQFLKSQNLASTGGQAKELARGGVLVNGAEEARPGRKLHDGDLVRVAGQEFPVHVRGA